MSAPSPRSLRRAYLEWVEEQIEDFKDRIPRAELLQVADDVVRDLRVTQGGQYQLTEVLLCAAMDRHIFNLLGLPGYRAWRTHRAAGGAVDPMATPAVEQTLIPLLAADRGGADSPGSGARGHEPPLLCVV